MSFIRKNVVFTIGSEATHVYIVKNGEFELSKKVTFSEKKIKLDLKVALLGKGEMFGDEEVLNETCRQYNCTCYSSTGELLAISAKDFLLKVKTDDNIALINKKNKAKTEVRHQRSLALESLFTNTIHGIKPKHMPINKIKIKRRYFPSLSRDKTPVRKSDYLELTEYDIKAIQAKAIPEQSGRMFIAMNAPVDFSTRTPSPYNSGYRIPKSHLKTHFHQFSSIV